jgi:hypothetical protein
MTTIEQLVGEFIDAWNAGRRPNIESFLQRAGPHERDELAEQLATWLEIASTPDYDNATRETIASELALTSALDTAAALRAPSPSGFRHCDSAPDSRSATSLVG